MPIQRLRCGAPHTSTLGMFSVLALRKHAKVDIVPTEEEFWKRLDHYIHRFDTSSPELEASHGECDGRLVDKIHAVVEPVSGPEGSDNQPWHHALDFFGDGVRTLEVDATRWPSTLIEPLHGLLTGEHEQFCILCKHYRNFTDPELELLGAVAILKPRIVIMQSLVRVLEHA